MLARSAPSDAINGALVAACACVVWLTACGRQDAASSLPTWAVPEPAPWELQEPASVGPDSMVLEVLVHEQNCASGQRADGRIAPPTVVESSSIIEITIGVHQLTEGQSCQENPATPFVVKLSSPVGDRDLLDGSVVPPAVRHRSG